MIFGPHASVDVSGSFAVSSADYLKLADGARFVASLGADDSALSTAPVSAFGFLGSTPGSIAFQQSQLSVPAGKTLSVIGGNVTIDGATLQAPGGRINLVSVKSPGEVPVTVGDLSASFPSQGAIELQNSAVVDASGDGGGQIVIRGGTLMIDNSAVEANTLGATDGQGIDIATTESLTVTYGGAITSSTAGSGRGGDIQISAPSIVLDGGGSTSGILADTLADGQGGNVFVSADSLVIRNAARISSATGGTGNGGNIDIGASTIQLDGQASFLLTGFSVQSVPGSTGNAGQIYVHPGAAGTLALGIVDGAQISAETDGSGIGGGINVKATSITLDVTRSDVFTATGISAQSFGSGKAGDINIDTGSIALMNGTEISAEAVSTGPGGNINITANTLNVGSSSDISATTHGESDGGNISISANTISLDGIQANGTPGFAGIFAGDNFGFGSGFHGGDISISADNLQVLNGAEISATVKGATEGGNITINAGALTIDNAAQIASSSTGSGNAGTIHISAGSVLLDHGGMISVSTSEPGTQAGDIVLNSSSDIRLLDHSEITAQAGPVDDSSNDGQNGGNITLTAPGTIYLRDSTLSAQAVNNGGNITLDPHFVVLDNGRISADAIFGSGGRLMITADFLFSSPGPTSDFITANSRFGTPGTVVIDATEIDLTGVLVGLPGTLLGADQQLPAYCGVRIGGGLSSFLVMGRGGLPLEPDGWLPSFGVNLDRGRK